MNITEVIHTSDLLKKFDYAEQALNDAVNLLAENPPVKKELGDAYYHLGDLYLIRLDWQKAEEAFTQSLTWARGSQFRYREISTLASLVSLYYLWNRSAGISDEQKKQNLKLMEERQDSLDGLSSEYSTEYPNLYGKYQLTLGNLAFDSALELLPNIFSQRRVEESLQSLSAAFDYYKRATEYMKQFKSSEHYYLTLRVISNRLGMLLKKFQEKGFLYDHKVEVRKILDEKLANKLPEDFKPFYAAILLRIAPQEKSVEIDQLITSIADAEEQEEFQRALLLNDCLIETYKMIVDSANKENTSQFTNVIEKILAQSRYYRIEGDEYQAEECLAEVRKDYLPKIMDSALRQGFEGYLLSHEGTLKYRRGEYGKLLEYYVQDLRETACQKFDIQYKNARADARALLAESEKKLTQSILEVSSQLQACKEQNERMRLQKWKTRFEAYRAENHFRMGELFTLSGEFEGDKGALEHLRKAIDYFQQTENLYRYHYAMQSYLEALYFSGNYENSFRYKERLPFENLLEEQTKQTHPSIPKMEKVHPSIMGRLRIIQADVLFSSYFTQPASPSRQKYSLRKKFEHADIPLLRDMVQKYVEACAFMEQQGKPHFEVAARVLQRRIELIGEPTILQEVIDALPPAWAKHSTLQEEEYRFVRASLVDFAKIRRMLLIENKKEEYEKGK